MLIRPQTTLPRDNIEAGFIRKQILTRLQHINNLSVDQYRIHPPSHFDQLYFSAIHGLLDLGVSSNEAELVVNQVFQQFRPTWAIANLFSALESGNSEDALVCLEQDEDLVHAEDDEGRTALIVAAGKNMGSVVKETLKMNSFIGYTCCNGNTALMEAAIHGSMESATLLLVADACTEQCNDQGITALGHALDNKRWDIMAVLIEAGASGLLCRNLDDSSTALVEDFSERFDEVIGSLKTGSCEMLTQQKNT